MATNNWRGDAGAVAQVNTLTVGGTPANGQVYTATIGLKSVSYTANGTDTNTTIATALKTALAASQFAEFQEQTWTNATTVVTATSKVAGRPFTVSSSGTGTGTLITAITTPSAGPNDWSIAGNWTLNAVPVSTNDVTIGKGLADILYGLPQSGVTLNSLTVAAGANKIGLAEYNGSYTEYRPTYLAIGVTTLTIKGGTRVKIDTGTVQTTLLVQGTDLAVDQGEQVVHWKGTHASNELNVTKGTVAVCPIAGNVATLATMRIGYQSSKSSDSSVICGAGLTLTTVQQSGGTLVTNSAVSNITKTDGVHTHFAGGITGTYTSEGGKTIYNSTATLNSISLANGASLDFSQDMRTRTVTNCTMYAGTSVSDPFRTVTWTNPVRLQLVGLPGVSLDLGQNISLAPVSF